MSLLLPLLVVHPYTLYFITQTGERAHMHTHVHPIPPLPSRLEPQPYEELSSFLARTAHHMQYRHHSWLLQPELFASPIISRNLSLLTAQDEYLFLSALLALSEEQIYAMTLHRFDVLSLHLLCFPPFERSTRHETSRTTPHRTPIHRPTLSPQVYQFACLPRETTQICSLCLQGPIAYDRLYWKVKYLITCPEHQLLLQRTCDRCRYPILSTRMNPLTCHNCKHKYYLSSTSLPSHASFLCQGDLLTLHALGVTMPHTAPDFPANAHDKRTFLPGVQYLALLRAISLSMRPLRLPDFQAFLPSPLYTILTQTHSRPFTPKARLPPLHIATIHWIFASFPHHFFVFLDALNEYRRRSGTKKSPFSSSLSTLRTKAPLAYQILTTPPHSPPRLPTKT